MSAERRGPARPTGKIGAAFAALVKVYGRTKPPAGETALDRVALASLVGSLGERAAVRMVKKLRERFVDWNEVRVARSREVEAAVPEVSEAGLRQLQSCLQALYEQLGGLCENPFDGRKQTEIKALLGGMRDLSSEDTEAVLLLGAGTPVLPAGASLVRCLRRLGAVPRNATRNKVQRAAMRAIPVEEYRTFLGLACQHGAGTCREERPDCRRCRMNRTCRSRGRW
jgi:endonuclease III